MTRILHVLSSLDSRTGGPAASILGLAPAQASLGLDVSVLSSDHVRHDGSSNAQRLSEGGVRVKLVGPTRGKRSRHPAIPHECRQAVERADVVHIHGTWELIQQGAAKAARTLNKPYVFRPCGMLDPWSLKRQRWLKELLLFAGLRKEIKSASALHFDTKTEELGTGPLFPGVPTIVEPNGVDIEQLSCAKPTGALRHRLGIASTTPLILFLGRVHYKKGIDVLIDAAGHLSHAQVDFQIVVAGPGLPPIIEQLRCLIHERGLENRIHFTGMLGEQARLEALGDANLFVLPSRHENFGISVAEAMAAGVPVLVSDQVALSHEVLESGAGRVVPLDSNRLAHAIGEMLGSPEARHSSGLAGKRFAATHFAWGSIAMRWKAHYSRLIDPL